MKSCGRWIGFVLLATLSLPAQQPPAGAPKQSPAAPPDVGQIISGVYHNPFFGFSYRLPYGWVDRTEDMRQEASDSRKAILLLSIFERPPEATGTTVNSAVVIAAESASSYPGLKNAAQYFGPLSELTKEKGLTAVNEPYEFPVDGKPIVRRDFMKQMGSVSMHQGTLALLQSGYVLSFTFIGGSDDEVTSLLEGLKFSYASKSKKNPAPSSGR